MKVITINILEPLHPGFGTDCTQRWCGACWCLRCDYMVWVQVWLWTFFACHASLFLCLLFLSTVK